MIVTGYKLVMQAGRLPDVPYIGTQDHGYKQDESSSCSTFFRPGILPVGMKLPLHLLEIFFLFIAQVVKPVGFHSTAVDSLRYVGKISDQQTSLVYFLLVALVRQNWCYVKI